MLAGAALATPECTVGALGLVVELARKKRGGAIMAVLNVTPDSFFDGGHYVDNHKAEARIREMLSDGADIIDVGAESTRPGSTPIPAQEQLKRLEPSVRYALAQGAIVSVDTADATVAEQALSWGVQAINDVSCLKDPTLAQLCAEANADLILMHSRGEMSSMPGFSDYEGEYRDVISDISREWSLAREKAESKGLSRNRIWFDPGLGFHKTGAQSAEIMCRLSEFSSLDAGLVLGASRKSFIGALDGSPPERRLGGSIAACLRGVEADARILRVHDVQEVNQALLAFKAWESIPQEKLTQNARKGVSGLA